MSAPIPIPQAQKPDGNVLTRLRAGQYLSPAERTVVKLGEGLLASGVIAGLSAAVQYVTTLLTGGSFSWSAVLAVFVSGALVGMLLASLKYVTAHKDDNVFLTLLNQALAAPAGQQAQQALEVDIEKLAGQLAGTLATTLGGKLVPAPQGNETVPPVPVAPDAPAASSPPASPPASPFPPPGV